MNISDLRLPCQHGMYWHVIDEDGCTGGRVPTMQELIEMLDGMMLSQYEMWQLATEATPGDGTESIPVFVVIPTGKVVPVGAPGSLELVDEPKGFAPDRRLDVDFDLWGGT